jgi:lysozyme
LPQNPSPPTGCRPLGEHEVTPTLSAWAVDLLHGPIDLFESVEGSFTLDSKTGVPLLAWCNVHEPDFQNHIRHRGITLYEVTGEVTGTTLVTMPAEGIDVSQFQKAIDWKAAASAPALYWRQKLFAFIRATMGASGVDAEFTNNWLASKGSLVRGAYHFLRTGEDVQLQAQHFVMALGGDPGELPPMIDVETYLSNGRYVTPTRDEVLAMLTAVRTLTDRDPVLYIGDALYKSMNLAEVTQDLSIAHYGVRKPETPSYSFHQYSQTGTCPGITTLVDLERFNGDAKGLGLYVEVSAPGFDEP